MTTTDTVPQSPDPRETYRAAWQSIYSLIGDGLPLPHAVTAYSDGGFTITFTDLSSGRTWAGALALELRNDTERHANSPGSGAITHYSGEHRGSPVALFVHEPGDLIGVPLIEAVADVEVYVGEPLAPRIAVTDYFREDAETRAPLPAGVEGYRVDTERMADVERARDADDPQWFRCLAERGES